MNASRAILKAGRASVETPRMDDGDQHGGTAAPDSGDVLPRSVRTAASAKVPPAGGVSSGRRGWLWAGVAAVVAVTVAGGAFFVLSGGQKTSRSAAASGGGEFCTWARTTHAAFTQSAANAQAPSVKQLYEQESAALDHAVTLAPPAIKADVETLASFWHKQLDALAAVNYDVNRLAPADAHAYSNPQLTSAVQRSTRYMASACGMSTTPNTVHATFSDPGGPLR